MKEKIKECYLEFYHNLMLFYYRYKLRFLTKKLIKEKNGGLSTEQIRQAKAYWSKYAKHFSPLWHELIFEKTKTFDVRYVPEDIHFTEFEPKINNFWIHLGGFNDKNYHKMYFPEVKHPVSLFRKINGVYHDDDYNFITEEEAFQACQDCGNVIIKNR